MRDYRFIESYVRPLRFERLKPVDVNGVKEAVVPFRSPIGGLRCSLEDIDDMHPYCIRPHVYLLKTKQCWSLTLCSYFSYLEYSWMNRVMTDAQVMARFPIDISYESFEIEYFIKDYIERGFRVFIDGESFVLRDEPSEDLVDQWKASKRILNMGYAHLDAQMLLNEEWKTFSGYLHDPGSSTPDPNEQMCHALATRYGLTSHGRKFRINQRGKARLVDVSNQKNLNLSYGNVRWQPSVKALLRLMYPDKYLPIPPHDDWVPRTSIA